MPRRSRIHSCEDARRLARRRLPRLVFDFIDGAAGRETAKAGNESRFDEIELNSRILAEFAARSLSTRLMGKSYSVPFGIAPMGMCGLAGRGADRSMAEVAKQLDMPVCLSSAGSIPMEDMQGWAEGRAWFQLYFGRSEAATMAVVDRAEAAGYETLILTADVPQVASRPRDLRNGFNLPFRISPRIFLDLALHPQWSLPMLVGGAPAPRNFDPTGDASAFDRNAGRSGADWGFLERLRARWRGCLIVKGVKMPEDAARIESLGADAVYVSNHGGRQLDSEPPAIDLVQPVRQAVSPGFPVLFDSGVRSGEDILKALALGANFVMIGRPVLFALSAEGKNGLIALLESLRADLSSAMAQAGADSIDSIGPHLLHVSSGGLQRGGPPPS